MRGKTKKVKCKNQRCGDEFEARVADVKRGWGKYCSKSCKAQHQESLTGGYRHYQGRAGREQFDSNPNNYNH